MRKHFLLLFLLTLLPLAGFAAVLDQTQFSATNIDYGTSTFPTVSATGYTVNTDYTVTTDKFFKDDRGSASIAASLLSTTGTGTYYIQIYGAGNYASQDPFYIPFLINGASIAAAQFATVDAVTFNGSAYTPKPAVTLTVNNEDVTLEENQDITYSWSSNIDAGTATITVTGMGTYSGTASTTFTINKANISASMVTPPTAISDLVYNGTAQTLVQDGSLNVASGSINATAPSFLYSSDNNNWYAAGNDAIKQTNAGSNYALYWKVNGGTNYNDYTPASNTVTGKIEQQMLVARAQKYTTFYQGNLNTNVITIKYDGFVNGEGNEDGPINNGVAGWTAPTGSFSSEVTTANFAAKTYTDGLELNGGSATNYEVINVNADLVINAAALQLTLMKNVPAATYGSDESKDNEWQMSITDIDDNSGDAEYVKLQYQTGVDANGDPTYTQVTTQANVKDYLIVKGGTGADKDYITGLFIKAAGNTSGAVNTTGYALTLEGGTAANSNYTIASYIAEDKKFIVNTAAVAIKAYNKAKYYGEADPTLTFTVTNGTITDDMRTTIANAMTRDEGETPGNYTIRFGTTEDQFTGYTIAYTPAKLVIQKANLTIEATGQTLYTGNTESDLDADEFTVTGLITSDNDATGTGINDAVDVSLSFAPMVYTFESYSAATGGTQYATGTAQVESFDATNGTTTIKVLTNAPYNNAITEDVAATFVGKTYTVAATDLSNVTGRLQLTDATTNQTINLWVAPTFVSGVQVGADNKLVAQTTPVVDGIVVTLNNLDDLAAKYNITLTDGSLAVIDLTQQLQLSYASDNNPLIEAANGTQVNVTFTSRTLKAGYWYTMVLPFDIRTADLVASLKALNANAPANPTANDYHTVYAIVNRFSTASTVDHIQFKLEMNSIPANEPFMIKTAEDINLKNAVFGTKIIKYSATPVITDAAGSNAGNEFRGVYATTSIKAAAPFVPAWYDSENSAADPQGPQWRVPGSAAQDVAPMEAYLVYSPDKDWSNKAPLITFEDLNENGTTSIVTFNAESKSFVNVDGWYTLNGVKLQGAPTEKGIYINNGKKIVIK